MDKLVALKSFVQSVKFGSFSAAAKHMGISQPAISQQIRSLENELGNRLINRTTRQLNLTEAGERYLVHAQDILERLEEADRSIRSEDDQMTGLLSLGLPSGFSETLLSNFLLDFNTDYPGIVLDISLSDLYADVVQERLDVAIRMGDISDDRLIVRKLGTAQRCLVASPRYLDEKGRPQQPSDLCGHDYLLYKTISTGLQVPFVSPEGENLSVRIRPSMIVNNSAMLRRAALAGRGIVLANRWLIDPYLRSGELELVLPEWRYPPHPVYAVYPSNRFIPLKVRRFVDRLQAFLEDQQTFCYSHKAAAE